MVILFSPLHRPEGRYILTLVYREEESQNKRTDTEIAEAYDYYKPCWRSYVNGRNGREIGNVQTSKCRCIHERHCVAFASHDSEVGVDDWQNTTRFNVDHWSLTAFAPRSSSTCMPYSVMLAAQRSSQVLLIIAFSSGSSRRRRRRLGILVSRRLRRLSMSSSRAEDAAISYE